MAGLPKKRSVLLLVIIFWSSFCFAGKIHPLLAKKAESSEKNELIPVIIRFEDTAYRKPSFPSKKRAMRALKDNSRKKQNSFEREIVTLEKTGQFKKQRNFWICNALYAEASPDAIKQLTKNPAVKRIIPNFKLSLPETSSSGQVYDISGKAWGLDKIGARRVWQSFSLTGRGIKIGHLDTGINPSHPALTGKIINWAEFDSSGNRTASSIPRDSDTHGTHTAGILVGGDGVNLVLGVAPQAKLLSAKVIDGSYGTFAQLLAGMEWVVDPDDNPETDDGADVVNMSLGISGICEEFVEPILNMVAAGVIPVVAVGNSGEGTSNSPANIPDAIAVGATNIYDEVCYFSSGESVSWSNEYYNGDYIKPDFSGPGSGIYSACSYGGYIAMSGTSMSSPYVAGVVALLLEKNPDFTAAQIRQILKYSSVDLGVEGKDTRFGWGRIDAFKACELAVSGAYESFGPYDENYGNWAYISTPQASESVWGNAVSVIAASSPFTKWVEFQISADNLIWDTISVRRQPPYSCYWDVTRLQQGEYYLRVKGIGRDGSEYYSSEQKVHVSSDDPIITENGNLGSNPFGYHKKTKKIFPGMENISAVAEGTAVIVPNGLFEEEKVLVIEYIETSQIGNLLPPPQSGLKPAGIFRKIEFADGNSTFEQDISIIMPFMDENNDGIVDGTNISSADLDVYYLREIGGRPAGWVKLESNVNSSLSKSVSASPNSLRVDVNHFTLFGIFGVAPQSGLGDVIVYPNPVTSRDGVCFDGLSGQANIKIFDVLGCVVKEVENVSSGSYRWELSDSRGKQVSNGIYFYLISDESGGKTKGKFAVAR